MLICSEPFKEGAGCDGTVCRQGGTETHKVPMMRITFEKFLRNEGGATAIEYGLIAVAIIVAVSNLGSSLNTTFTSVQTALK